MSDDTQTPAEVTDAPVSPEAPEKETSKRQMSFSVLDDGTIRADFGPGLDPLTLNPGAVPETIIAAATTEGLIARARGYTSKLEGDSRTPASLREAIAKAFTNLLAGVWKIERAPGSGGEYTIEVEAALVFRQMRAASKGETCADTIEQVAAHWETLTDDQRKQVKDLPRYKAAFAQVKAARQAEKAKALMAEADKAEENAPF